MFQLQKTYSSVQHHKRPYSKLAKHILLSAAELCKVNIHLYISSIFLSVVEHICFWTHFPRCQTSSLDVFKIWKGGFSYLTIDKTRPSVKYAKDWLPYSWSGERCQPWMWSGSHFSVYLAIFSMIQSNNWVILVQTYSWPVRRQSFATIHTYSGKHGLSQDKAAMARADVKVGVLWWIYE